MGILDLDRVRRAIADRQGIRTHEMPAIVTNPPGAAAPGGFFLVCSGVHPADGHAFLLPGETGSQ
jgi:hypothetical protein